MKIQKYACILWFMWLPLIAVGQEWSRQDSLRIKQLLQSEQEIHLNEKIVKEMGKKNISQKPLVDFDYTLPSLTVPQKGLGLSPTLPKRTFPMPGTHFSPNYFSASQTWLKVNGHLNLHSNSNFGKTDHLFRIQSQIEYRLSPQWSFSIYGSRHLGTRRVRALPFDVTPTQIGSAFIFKPNKKWKIKGGMQYQYNAVQKRWEWVPQVCFSYEFIP